MTTQNNGIVFNSSLLFVIASTLAMTLHESGHFLMGGLVNADDLVLYHNYVSDSDVGLTLTQTVLIKAAGPAVSLMIGFLFHFVCSRQRKRNLLFLFNLYMSVFGYIGFFGYLIIAPLFTSGDTGYICYALGFPMWLTIGIAILGAFALYLLMLQLVQHFVEMGTAEIATHRDLRVPFIRSLIFYPLWIGIVITSLLNLPIPTWLSLIAPICSPFTILWTYGQALSKKFPTERMNHDMGSISRIQGTWIIFFLLTVVLNRILAGGISLG